jgi:hypothetical protein
VHDRLLLRQQLLQQSVHLGAHARRQPRSSPAALPPFLLRLLLRLLLLLLLLLPRLMLLAAAALAPGLLGRAQGQREPAAALQAELVQLVEQL